MKSYPPAGKVHRSLQKCLTANMQRKLSNEIPPALSVSKRKGAVKKSKLFSKQYRSELGHALASFAT